jgi:dipeptidyl aminopeptidase/acylaminoacyl peptidase
LRPNHASGHAGGLRHLRNVNFGEQEEIANVLLLACCYQEVFTGGEGADFRLKNIQSQGFGDFDDVIAGVDMLVQQGIADPDRLGVMGWSYGGFLTAWVIGHSNRFKAASVGAPATDWMTYYAQSDGPRSTLWTYFGGSPWDKAANYNRHSPRSGIANIRTPSLLQVGALDINHNSEIYWSLTDRNIPVEYVVYPREPHGFIEPGHQRDVMERNLRWFLRWLR